MVKFNIHLNLGNVASAILKLVLTCNIFFAVVNCGFTVIYGTEFFQLTRKFETLTLFKLLDTFMEFMLMSAVKRVLRVYVPTQIVGLMEHQKRAMCFSRFMFNWCLRSVKIVIEGMEYADKLDKFSSSDITPVIDAYQHAVLSQFPRGRYAVGHVTRLVYLPLSYLPDWLSDPIMEFLNFSQLVPAAAKRKND
jgi:hypothetical protein